MWAIWIVSLTFTHTIHAQYGTYSFSLINKLTNQSSVYTESHVTGSSDKAVDGNTANQFHHDSCTHTDPGNDVNPWWAVDMGDLITVFSITLTNRKGVCCHDRLNRFSVYGSNTTFNPYNDANKHLCYTFDGEFGDGVTRTFNCGQAITARYLSITNATQINEKKILTLCEAQIKAVCPDSTYGENCTGICSPHCKSHPCDKFTAVGSCFERSSGKCVPGYTGDNCTIPCSLGTYGDGCKACSPHCKNHCVQTSSTGICHEGGCLAGFIGDACNTACEPGSYGIDCANICSQNCKNYPCNKVTGACPNGLCKAGFQGDMCNTHCEDGQYGENCVNLCSNTCKQQFCSKINGACIHGECLSGYHGDMCEEDCPMGTYGDRCRFNCSTNCRNQCISISEMGKCIDGCVTGYTGTTCEIECSYNTFGQNCHPCSSNCESVPCDKETGECPEGKCAPGFIGFNCAEECPYGRFGVKCLSECFPNCKDTCHHVDGSCRAGCNAGWTGEKCDIINKDTMVIVLAVLLGLFVILCLGLIVLLLSRRYCNTPTVDNQREMVNFEHAYLNVLGAQALDVKEIDQRPGARNEDVTKKDVDGARCNSDTYEKVHVERVQGETIQEYEELCN